MALFLKIRRKINHQLFHGYSKENNASLQLIQGMTEIKLLNIEQPKRWEWENVQSDIFRLNYKNLSYGQIQQAGALFINQGKDVFLIFLAADQVIRGQLSFGSLLAIQYIVGQLSGPVDQFIRFVQDAQNAKNSIDRLNDVHELEDECKPGLRYRNQRVISGGIEIRNLTFGYSGKKNSVLKDLRLDIPEGKTTAILGVSGSGKTTLMKVLLKYFSSYEGEIRVGGQDLKDIDPVVWRRNCAAVLPDGYVFNESIEKNIAVQVSETDQERLYSACRVANILEFIEGLPDGFQTRLGVGGAGISQGQKQRLLIARAVYRDASFIFFDESTNALDTHTEKTVVNNLRQVFAGKTVVIIAHRLSTIKDADNIVVLNSGRIAEEGSHVELSARRGRYYELMQSQHELNSR
jgi:ATP-binding cassette subfamily B protein